MAHIEIRPEDALAAAAKVTAAAERISYEMSVFRSAGDAIASRMRSGSLRSALAQVIEPFVAVPSETADRFSAVASAGVGAVEGMVAIDQDGARMMAPAPSRVVPA